MLGLRPPGLEFRILCLEDSVISIISSSSGGSPGPVYPICAQRWPKARFISFHFCLHSELALVPISFQSDIKRSSKHVGPSVRELLPFVPQLRDVTLRLFGIWKGTSLKSDLNFKKQAVIFITDVSFDDIISACEEAIDQWQCG